MIKKIMDMINLHFMNFIMILLKQKLVIVVGNLNLMKWCKYKMFEYENEEAEVYIEKNTKIVMVEIFKDSISDYTSRDRKKH